MRLVSDFLACLRFYSRLPVPVFAFEPAPHAMLDFARSIRMLPLAGLVIALPGALVLMVAGSFLPPEIAAGLALAALVATTGAFHEDGLADTADGFGGGSTIERKLEIMRDSRIGTYGGVALVLSLLLRWAALASLLHYFGPPLLAAAIVLGGAGLTRWLALLPLVLLPPARKDGAAWAAARPEIRSFAVAGILAIAAALLPYAAGQGFGRVVVAGLLAAAGSGLVSWLAHRQIGGQTGDVAGAAQQVAEITWLLVFCASI